MGYNKQSIVIVAALLLLAVATPLAYGQTVNVKGRLCCTSNGNCHPGSAGVAGVAVSLNCTNPPNEEVTAEQDITNLNGQFILTVNASTIPCVAIVNLPLNSTNCPRLNTASGTLVGIPLADPLDINSLPLINATVELEFTGPINLNAP